MNKCNLTVATWLFSNTEAANGGDYRSAQIRELLDSVGIKYTCLEAGKAPGILEKAILFICRLLSTWKLPTRFPMGLNRYVNDYVTVRSLLKSRTVFDVLIWEATGEPSTVLLLRKIAKRVVAVPQNIESLGAQRTGTVSRDLRRFSNEIHGLSLADCVFTISEEESWLLRLVGIQALCLPYYPPEILRNRLSSIRGLRTVAETHDGYLSLGSVSNPPTRIGMQELQKAFRVFPPDSYRQVTFAGNGFHSGDVDAQGAIRIRGRLSDFELDRLRVEIKGLVVFQPATTGVLTRVAESLYAGIPVIANVDAARGYTKSSGVYLYHNWRGLKSLLDQDYIIPDIPVYPAAECDSFLEAVISSQVSEKGDDCEI